MSQSIAISRFTDFDAAFGEIGLKPGPRTGPTKRTQDAKEWFVVRGFLKAVLPARMFGFPLSIRKECPPAPDFALEYGGGAAVIEITEATSRSDQREMTISESREDLTTMLGEFGGRFSDGAVGDLPERIWVADVLRAIRRKRDKSIFACRDIERHLLIYPNSNAVDLVDERGAIGLLREVIVRNKARLLRRASGCAVHVFGDKLVCCDILERMKFVERKGAIEEL